jgi:putative tryptophan/tyrosine transport system substrate-binding protein
MRRRELIALLLGGAAAATVAWPFGARAQQHPDRVQRIAVLMGIANDLEGQDRVLAFSVHSVIEIEGAMAALGREPGGGLIVIPDVFSSTNVDPIVALAARHRLPALYPFPFFARQGGLVSYGIDLTDLFRRSASYIDRILRGTKPGELPVQTPNKFELMINLKTARALGLEVSAMLLARADEVIE